MSMIEAENEALKSENAGLRAQLESLQYRIKHDYIEVAEYRRVQAVLRSTQQFCSKYKREARGGNGRLSLADQRGPDGETAAQRVIRERRAAQ